MTLYVLTTIFLCDNEIDNSTTIYTNKEQAQKAAQKELQTFKTYILIEKNLMMYMLNM